MNPIDSADKAGPVFGMRHPWLRLLPVVLCLLCLAPGRRAAESAPPVPITQRRINEMAAALEEARRTLIAETGLRLPGEALSHYLARIAAPLPGETPARHRARITGYLAALQRATALTASGRQAPHLLDDRPANRLAWEQAASALRHLPGHVARLEAAWQRCRESRNPPSREFVAELGESVHLLLTAYEKLRDAQP
ncbi:MAG TPA: hypothetical protein VFB38_09900 [Chthonomonadaceae bacterium]|nr:hypothetical protein [Chthonomonadaceae bacterium]